MPPVGNNEPPQVLGDLPDDLVLQILMGLPHPHAAALALSLTCKRMCCLVRSRVPCAVCCAPGPLGAVLTG